MLVDQLYIDLKEGEPYFVGDKKLVKQEGSPMAVRSNGCYISFSPHTVVLVESDKIIITREQFFERFPHLRSWQ